ncbi:hypothetical protein [Kribbella sp. VKM Ac-2568]|uniref:hypothetical protein n=1 Tax=Kribbella sp. VKM Ac-2568 TaxID=2512219 RepID=UPI001F547E98|nr:hypothetical protein [Kribbella sp. VKM Ac-2568]
MPAARTSAQLAYVTAGDTGAGVVVGSVLLCELVGETSDAGVGDVSVVRTKVWACVGVSDGSGVRVGVDVEIGVGVGSVVDGESVSGVAGGGP